MKTKCSFLFQLLMGIQAVALAQQSGFKSYSIEDGLPQSEILSLVQTHDGAIWAGTNGGGLARFNGQRFEVYNKHDGLPDNIINSLIEDQQGILWIGSASGLTRFDGISFKTYPINIDDGPSNAVSLVEDVSGRIWMNVIRNKSDLALYYFNKKMDSLININEVYSNFQTEPIRLFKNNPAYSFMVLASKNKIYISTHNELYEFIDNEIFRSQLGKNQFPDETIIIPTYMDGDKLWCRIIIPEREHAFYIYCEGKFKKVDFFPEDFPVYRIAKILRDSHNRLWITTWSDGILMKNDTTLHWYSTKNGMPSNYGGSIIEDYEGNIWLAFRGGGLVKYGDKRFMAYDFRDIVNGNIVRVISQDSQGNYWFFLQGNGLIKYDGLHYETFTPEEYPFLKHPVNLIPQSDGKLLIITAYHIYEYYNGRFQDVKARFHLDYKDRITQLIKHKNAYYLSVIFKGVFKFENSELINLGYKTDFLEDAFVFHLLMDSKDRLWVSSNRNIARYDGESFEYHTGKGVNEALQAAEDSAGNIWFASVLNGLIRFRNDTFQLFNTTNSDISSEIVYSVLVDPTGEVWAGTQVGVDNIVLASDGSIKNWRKYDRRDGFTGSENNARSNYVDNQGNLWFGTIEGAMRYIPPKETFNNQPPITNMRTLNLFYKEINWKKAPFYTYYDSLTSWTAMPSGLDLPSNQNNITFNFEGISYQVPEKIRYQWYLEGLEKDWSPVSNNQSATYASLGPGEYTFYVRSANSDGIWSAPVTYSFEISPPFYGTWWFRGLSLVLIALIVHGILRMRINTIKRKKRMLEDQVTIKTGEILKQKEEITSQANKLRSSLVNLKEANENIKRQKGEIESKNKELTEINKEKNHLIGIIAHDLRNPLTSTISITNSLKEDKANLTEDQLESLEFIQRVHWRMNKMISKILDIQVLESQSINLKKEKINLADIVKAVECNFLPTAGKKNIQIITNIQDVLVETDRGYTAQVFENLLSNAIKFSPPNAEVCINLFEDNGYARVEIADQGPGFSDEDKKKLFGKFQVLSAQPTAGEKSIGLGLSIVKKYVEALDGKVWCESEHGKGARFNVQFKRFGEN